MEQIGKAAERVVNSAVFNHGSPKAFIFDIDGTLADHHHRLHHIMKPDKDWKSFKAECINDPIIEPMAQIFESILYGHIRPIFVTGRSEDQREDTLRWFRRNLHAYIPDDVLFMRKDGDYRPDIVVKKELFLTTIQEQFEVIAVFEDRARVVEMWRSLGLTCLQVSEGNY